MKLKKFFSLMTLALAAVGFSACNSDSNDELTVQVSNIVTYQGNANSRAVLTYQGVDDDAPITLRATPELDPTKVKIGDRVFVMFNVPAGSTLKNDMEITLIDAFGVPTVTPEVAARPANWESSQSLYVQTLFRSGTWLNMQALIPATSTKFDFKLYVDPESLNTEEVEAYMVYTNSESDFGVTNAPTFACFNIASIWNLPTCKKLIFHVNNSNGVTNSVFEFVKK